MLISSVRISARFKATSRFSTGPAHENWYGNNVADENPGVAKRLLQLAVDDAEGSFPDFILELAENQMDAPGCSDLAARERA